jgi:hypothetical protein
MRTAALDTLPKWFKEKLLGSVGCEAHEALSLKHQAVRIQKMESRKVDYAFVGAPKAPPAEFISHSLTHEKLMKLCEKSAAQAP